MRFWLSTLFALTSITIFAENNLSTTATFAVASYSDIIYIQELESLHLLLTEDNIRQARLDAESNPMATSIAQNVEICVLNNNKSGLLFSVTPTSYGMLSAQQAGKQQDKLTNGDNLLLQP